MHINENLQGNGGNMECDRTYSVNILQKIAGAVKNGKNWYEAVDAVAYQTETAWLGIAFSGKKVVARMA